MKVTLITGTWPDARCGVGDYAACLAAELAAQGERVAVLTSRAATACARPGVSLAARVHSWRAANLPGLAAAAGASDPEVAHLLYPTAAYGRGAAPVWLFAWLRLARPRIARVVTLHEYAQYSCWGRLRLWPLVAAADAVICTNHRDRRALRRSRLGRRAGVRVIPLGSNVGPAGNARPLLETGAVHFGTVMPNKGWETMLDALALLRGRGRDARLTVIGALEPDRYAYHRRVAARIARLGLQDAVRFTGYLPPAEADAALAASGAFAVLPFSDGASLNRGSLVAVLAHGLAVLTTRPEAPLEGLRHDRDFWSVPPRDPDALAAAWSRLLDDPALVARLQAGARAAAARFAWPRIAARTRKCYGGLTT